VTDTAFVRCETLGLPWTPETALPLLGADNNARHAVELACVFGIFNDHGSNRTITLKDLEIRELTARGLTTGGLYPISCFRITTFAGGIDISEQVVSMDSDNAALPSQVQIVRECNGTTSDPAFRICPVVPAHTGVTFWNRGGGFGGGLFNKLSRVHAFNSQDGAAQPFTLDESQGLMLQCGPVNQPAKELGVTIVFTIEATGATHVLTTNVVTTPSTGFTGMLAIWNGSGSGVSLLIKSIEVYEIANSTATTYPLLSLESISSMKGGRAITPVYMDSTHTALSAGVRIQTGGAAVQFAQDVSLSRNPNAGGDTVPWRRRLGVPFGNIPAITTGLIGLLGASRKFSQIIGGNDANVQAIVLEEGEGVAIVKRTTSSLGNYEISATLIAEDNTPAAGGGARAFAFCG